MNISFEEMFDVYKKFDVYLDIEIPHIAVQELVEEITAWQRLTSDHDFFAKYKMMFESFKEINWKINKDIGKKIINFYVYVTPANPFTFNIYDEHVINRFLQEQKNFLKKFFSIDDSLDDSLKEKIANSFLWRVEREIGREEGRCFFLGWAAEPMAMAWENRNFLGFLADTFPDLFKGRELLSKNMGKLAQTIREYVKECKLNVEVMFLKTLKKLD